MKYLFLILFCFSLVSCTKKKPSCELTEKYANTAALGIAGVFDCKKPEMIAKDIQAKVEELNMCHRDQQTGPIAAIVCKPVASYVTKLIVKQTLPRKWECSGGVPSKALEVFIYNGCASLPF